MKTFAALATTAIILLGLAWSWNDAGEPPTDLVEPPKFVTPDYTPDHQPDSPDRPKVATQQGDALHFEAALSHGAILDASFDEIFAEVRVQAGETFPENRPPLNVALVIDRSGSMSGEPMNQAREAARTFVNALEPIDRISIVSFDHQSRIDVQSTLVDEEGRARLNRAIDQMRVGGATNISDGLRDGFEQVRQFREATTVDRVVLMTDGIPNVGISDTEGLKVKTRSIRNEGITVSALGFGTMYNSEMMAAMAVEGAGNFRHIRTSQDLELAFSEELDDLRNTVASGIQLELRPKEGVKIANIYGFNSEDIQGGQRITLGDMHATARRSVIVRLEVDKGRAGSRQDLLGVQSQFVDRIVERPLSANFDLGVQRVRRQKEVDNSVNSQVMARVEEIRTQESLREVMDLYASGQAEQATKRLEVESRRSRRARRTYQIEEESEEAQRVENTIDRIGTGIRQNPSPRSAPARDMMFQEADISSATIPGRCGTGRRPLHRGRRPAGTEEIKRELQHLREAKNGTSGAARSSSTRVAGRA